MFAARTRAPHQRLGQSCDKYVEVTTDILTTLFGLKHARKTRVGDALIRGVSSGEKKRVSICEALATRACVVAWDNSTRGLDASTALEFIKALRIAIDISKLTTVVSLYQAGESLYRLFDKVCVIYEGKMAYYGPASEARSYFIDMGYEPANRQTTADFLVAVTDPNARIPRKSYRDSVWLEHAKHARPGSSYTISIPMQARAVMTRRLQMLWGNMLVTSLNAFSFVFQAVIMGTVYLKSKEDTVAYFSRGGVLFFALLFSVLVMLAEIPALFPQRAIVLRHGNWALYHPFIDQAALSCVFFLFVFTVSICMKGFYRTLAAACKDERE
ncbi:hypothetical protein C8J56DRAFT_999572 [Mycena floridula]|nr:hypothetical protein C8J56DRAFT_999572 [Mycena floridula]